MLVNYRIGLHANWATRDVRVAVQRGVEEPAWLIGLTVDERKRWQVQQGATADEDPIPEALGAVQGLVDIDLGFSPATNTLPIRRLEPRIGDTVDVTAVWLRFPELTIEPLRQRYTRLGEQTYRYESGGGAFVAKIEVDDLGLVVTYEGGWRRIAQASRDG